MFGVRVDRAGDSDASSATMASVDSQHVCFWHSLNWIRDRLLKGRRTQTLSVFVGRRVTEA